MSLFHTLPQHPWETLDRLIGEEEEEERGGIPHSDGRTEGEEEKSRSGHKGEKGKGDLGGKYPRKEEEGR